MNKYQRRVIKVYEYLNARAWPYIPRRKVVKDARETIKGIIKYINPNFINEKW
jgi:hypothetical protein